MKYQGQESSKEKLSYRDWQEKDKLSLRKNQIFDKLFTKRKLFAKQEEQNKGKYIINISSISTNPEIIKNAELYIKTKFDIKNWFPYIFSKNIIQIKESLYLIDLYVRLQLDEIKDENRALSRNNYELINCLCQYLNHTDKQIAFYSCRIIANLTYFPYNIEKLIYSDKNLKQILFFINNNNFGFGYEIICLLINCCANINVAKFFVDNKIIERITFLIETDINELDIKYYIYLIRLFNMIIRVFDEYEYNEEQIKNWFKPLLNFVKHTLKNQYVENTWFQKDHGKYYLKIISFYAHLSINDSKLMKEIIKDYVNVLIEFYYKLDEGNRCKMMEIFVDFLSLEDSVNETFIEDGILGMLINEINRIEYKNNKLLKNILFSCANIACGTTGQIEQLFAQGLIWKAIDISYFYLSQNFFNTDIKDVIRRALCTLNESIIGCSNHVKTELIIYQEYLIVSLYYLALKNIWENPNDIEFIIQMGKAINKLINCGEGDLDNKVLEQFRNKFIFVGMEDLVNNILMNYDDKNLQFCFGMIQEFIQGQES